MTYFLLNEEAAVTLGKLADLQAVPALIQALQAQNSHVTEGAAEALREIMPRCSDPNLRAALPSLRRLRKRAPVFQEVLAQIEQATVSWKDLPLPAAAPPPNPKNLPRPASADVPLLDDGDRKEGKR